ncbi:unnamed protein product [Rhizoctonia solani]|uniref:Uncharacterized protein n=1 Tax=Rhizoctonia solani TaxID=456999 RepID=A0A8H3H573_9AGAM|nr:unnamed protein product [Rhizoctonia solani]
MTIHNGLYKISTKTNDSRLYVGLSRNPEPSNVNEGIQVLAVPKSQTTIVEVRSIDADLYELHLWYHSGLGIGYNVEPTLDSQVVATSNANEWLIEQGSRPNRYKISIPDTNLYWTAVPGGHDMTRIALNPLEGKIVPEWTFELQRNHE